MSRNSTEAEKTASGTVGIWGPKTNRELTAKERNQGVKSTSVFEKPSEPRTKNSWLRKKKSVKSAKRRWGLMDVLIGFAVFITLQVLYAIGVIIWQTSSTLQEGGSIEDTDALVGDSFESIITGDFLFISSILMYVGWMFAMRRATFKKGLGSFAKDFWLKFKWKRDIPLGLLFAAVMRGFEWVVTTALVKMGVDMSTGGNTDLIVNQEGIWYILNAFVIAAIAAPFFEELFFRGLFLQGALRNFRGGRFPKPKTFFGRIINDTAPSVFAGYASARRWMYRNRNWLAVVLSSVVFGFMHFQPGTETFAQWFVVIFTGFLGLILALIVLKTKRLGLVICGHVFFNLSGVILATLLAS